MSGSFDVAASPSSPATRASLCQPAASTIRAASSSSDRVASLGRPNQVVPPSTNSNSALSAAPLLVRPRSEEHTSELQSPCNIVCRLLLEKKEDKERIQVFSGTVIMKKGAGINQTFT